MKKDIGVLGGTAQLRVFRVHGPASEIFDGLPVHQGCHIVIVDELNFLNLHTGSEPIKKVHKGKARSNAGQMRHQGQIHHLLHGSGSQQGKSGLPHRIDVRVVTEYGKRMGCHGACRNVKHHGHQFSGNLVHVGDHQQQPLGGRKGGGKCPRGETPVNSAGSTGFRLHLRHIQHLAEDILASVGCPLITIFAHGAGRRNGIDGRHIAHGVSHMGRRLISLDGFDCRTHNNGSFHMGNGVNRFRVQS